MNRYTEEQLEQLTTRIAEHMGVPPDDAAILAESLVDADLHGTSTHGLSRLNIYLQRIEKGLINPKAQISIRRAAGGILALDACNGLGQVQARKLDEALDRQGLQVVGVDPLQLAAHHDPELGGVAWGNYFDPLDKEPSQRSPKNMSSPYVPPDSWIYQMFDRLAALGFLKTGYAGIRPWTRMECARLVEEAQHEMPARETDGGEGPQAIRELQQEFNDELARLEGAANVGASMASVYARAGTRSAG